MIKNALMATVAALALWTAPAQAVVVFDFGTIGADGGPVCAADCVIAGAGPHNFTVGTNTVVARAFQNAAMTIPGFLTQKPGVFGTETGLGESDTFPNPSDADFEIATGKVVTLDNSGVAGKLLSVAVGSLQGPDEIEVFSGKTLAGLVLRAILTGSINPQMLDLSVFGDTFVEFLGIGPLALDNNTLALQETFTSPVIGTSEPGTLAVLGAALLTLWFSAKRRKPTQD